jgi:ribonuclease BN (tRNA processing enzyme)
MKIALRGVRGSIPTFNPATQVYGGNTSCLEIEKHGWLLVIDAGSGITNLNFNQAQHFQRIDILLTHLHMDHIQGLVFYEPLFDPTKEVHIWGPVNPTQTLRARLGRYFSPPFSPVYFRDLSCDLHIHEIGNSSFQFGPFAIESRFVIHPGPTVGFRIHADDKVVTYIPDHEPALGRGPLHHNLKWVSGSELAFGTDLLIHDGQYTREEYKYKSGWGHSAMEDALEFASMTGAKRLILTHHDPIHSDTLLDQYYRNLKISTHYPFPYEMAVEGTMIEM